MIVSCEWCSARWRHAERRGHCAAAHCHRTFSSASAFDRHLTMGGCRNPATVKTKGDPAFQSHATEFGEEWALAGTWEGWPG